MYKEMLFEYQISDDLFDNAPYPKQEIKKYDIDSCFEELLEKVKEYRISLSEYPNIKKPRLTTNYEIRYECFIQQVTDGTGDYVEKKCDTEIKIKLLYSNLVKGLSCLSRSEFTYFMDYFLYDLSENKVIEKLETTRFLFNPLRESCIVKMSKAFNIDLLK